MYWNLKSRENGREVVSKDKMTISFPKIINDIKPQIQEIQIIYQKSLNNKTKTHHVQIYGNRRSCCGSVVNKPN